MIYWSFLKRCCSPIPQRFIVATMVMTGIAVAHLNRLMVNLVLTDIVFAKNVSEELSKEVCHYNDSIKMKTIDNTHAEFHWSASIQANILGGFYIGYTVSQIPGGVLANLFGPKKMLGYGMLLSMLITFLTPWIARTNVYLLVASRVAMGLAQGALFPSMSLFVARWSLPHERSFVNSYTSSGVMLGGILSSAPTGFLLYNLNKWDHVFYIYGVGTLVWYIFWYLFAHDSTLSHPFISETERQKLDSELNKELDVDTSKLKVPYYPILKSIPVWAMVLANCGHDMAFYIIVTMLPQYMSRILRFNVKDNGLLNTLPFIGMVLVSLSSAKLGEKLIKKGYLTKTNQCKIWIFLANIGSCVLFLMASYSGCDRVVVVILFTIAMAFQGLTHPSVRVVNVDMSPNFAGTLMSIMNCIGALWGYLIPIIFAEFITDQTVRNWRNAFWFCSVIIFLLTIVFVFWGTSEVQPWNFPSKPPCSDEEEEKKHNEDNNTKNRKE